MLWASAMSGWSSIALLVGGDRLVEAALQRQRIAEVGVGIGGVGLKLRSPGGSRRVASSARPGIEQGGSEAIVGCGIIGLERDRPAVGVDRLVEPARVA